MPNDKIELEAFRPVLNEIQQQLPAGSLFTARKLFTVYADDYEYGTPEFIKEASFVLIIGAPFLFRPKIRIDGAQYFHAVTPVLVDEAIKNIHFGVGYLKTPQSTKKAVIQELLLAIDSA